MSTEQNRESDTGNPTGKEIKDAHSRGNVIGKSTSIMGVIKSTINKARFFLQGAVETASGRKYMLLVHGLIMGIAVMVVFIFRYDLIPGARRNDFSIYYFSARVLVEGGYENIYTIGWLPAHCDCAHFRYFPTTTLFYLPLGMLPSVEIAYLTYVGFAFVMVVCTLYLIRQISKKLTGPQVPDSSTWQLFSFVYLISYSQYVAYNQGQPSHAIGLLLLAGMFFCVSGKQGTGLMFTGLAMALKPTSMFIILFLLIFSPSIRDFLKRGVLLLAPVSTSILFFLAYPGLLGDFLEMMGYNAFNYGVPLPSISLTNLLVTLSGWQDSHFIFFLITATMFSGYILVGMRSKIKSLTTPQRDALAFFLGSACYFTCMFDVWPSQLPFFTPFVVLFFLSSPRVIKITRKEIGNDKGDAGVESSSETRDHGPEGFLQQAEKVTRTLTFKVCLLLSVYSLMTMFYDGSRALYAAFPGNTGLGIMFHGFQVTTCLSTTYLCLYMVRQFSLQEEWFGSMNPPAIVTTA